MFPHAATDRAATGVLSVHRGTSAIVDFRVMPTFAQRLRSQGYRTTVTGKWQRATLERHPDHPRDAGFDSWCLWQIWKTNAGVGEKTRYWNLTLKPERGRSAPTPPAGSDRTCSPSL